MREPILVFICLRRLSQLNVEAFNWVCDSLGLADIDPKDEEFVEELSNLLEADIGRFGENFILRDNVGMISVWSPNELWPAQEQSIIDLVESFEFNPIRINQEGYTGSNFL